MPQQPIGVGHYDEQGNACFKFNLRGVRHEDPGPEFTGILDTGFTGFIHLPIQHALSLRLPLEGTQNVSLADGSSQVLLTALARATIAQRTEEGVALLSFTSEDILLGMDFLRRFERTLVVSRKAGIVLIEEDQIPTFEESGDADE